MALRIERADLSTVEVSIFELNISSKATYVFLRKPCMNVENMLN